MKILVDSCIRELDRIGMRMSRMSVIDCLIDSIPAATSSIVNQIINISINLCVVCHS